MKAKASQNAVPAVAGRWPPRAKRERPGGRWFPRPSNKDAHRYYLFPGMGGRAARRKRLLILRWTLAAALLVSAVLSAVLYWLNQR